MSLVCPSRCVPTTESKVTPAWAWHGAAPVTDVHPGCEHGGRLYDVGVAQMNALPSSTRATNTYSDWPATDRLVLASARVTTHRSTSRLSHPRPGLKPTCFTDGCSHTSGSRHTIPFAPRRETLCQPYDTKPQGRSHRGGHGGCVPRAPYYVPLHQMTTDSLSSELTFDEWHGVILQRIIRPKLLLHVINHYTTCCF